MQNAHLIAANCSPISNTRVDSVQTDRSARDGLCRRMRLLATLATHATGSERIVLEARVHLVVRTIMRG